MARLAQLVALLAALAPLAGAVAVAGPRETAPLVVFSGARGGDAYSVYTIRPDGTGRRSLGAGYAYAEGMRPAWSRDGRRVAFSGLWTLAVARADGRERREIAREFDDNIREGASWSNDGSTVVVPGESYLWRFDVERGTATRLSAWGELPTFSPDGKLIAFLQRGLLLMDQDGRRSRRVAPARGSTETHAASPPSWSPDGRRIVYESDGDIFVYDLARARRSNLTPGRGPFDTEPTWSPNGRWIAFVRGQPEAVTDTATGVSIMRPDGTGLRVLTDESFVESSPTWSPDSRRLAFLGASRGRYGAGSAYVVSVVGGRPRRLFRPPCQGGQISGLTWGRGGRLAFASVPAVNDAQIYAARTDGADGRRLATSCAEETDPAWSPDGRQIAYASGKDVYVMQADGTGKRRVTVGGEPGWAPDGQALVFSRRDGQTYQLYSTAGGRERRLTASGSNSMPSWSATADRIAFTSSRDGRPEIYTMRPDGSAQQRITQLGGLDPSWSPDSKRIAFVYESNIWTIGADGSGAARLTPYDGCTEVYPAWSPDGQTIAFTIYSNDDEIGGLAFLPANGGDARWMPYSPFVGALGLDGAVIASSPDWYPLAGPSPRSVRATARVPTSVGQAQGCIRP